MPQQQRLLIFQIPDKKILKMLKVSHSQQQCPESHVESLGWNQGP